MDEVETKQTHREYLQDQLQDYEKRISACVDQETKEELTDKYLEIKKKLSVMEFYNLN